MWIYKILIYGGVILKKAMIYVHGKGGSYLEAEQFKNICLDFDVFGVDYNDYFPWIVKNKIMALKINDENAKELIASGKPVVIDFWAEWCGPCRAIAPSVDELAEEYEGKVIIGKYNVDDDADLSAEYSIRNIPTLLFFKEGKLVDKHVGSASKADLEAKIKALL